MKIFNTILDNYIDWYLFGIILLSGMYVTKFTKALTVIPNTYKVLIAATLISVVAYFITDCDKECWPKYLFTYTVVTSFYEVFVKGIRRLINSRFK